MSATAACLSCPVCSHGGVFESVQSLRDRLIYVSTNKIPCPVCQEEVSGLDKLTIHLFSHVKILTSNKCEDFQESKQLKNINLENQTPQQKKPKPTSKNKSPSTATAAPMKYVKIFPKLPVISFNTVPVIDISRGSVEENMKSVSPTPPVKTELTLIQVNTTCDVCGLQFVDADILRMHRCLIHNIDDNNSNQNVTRYQCHLCPKNFKMRGSLMVHLRVAHYGFLSGNCNSGEKLGKDVQEGKSIEKTDDKILVLERNDNKQWQCDVCRKCFTTKYFLKKHKRLHTGETPYSCAQCNKTFTFQQSYHKHLLYHNDEKPHTCSFCGRAFKELSTLHNHQRIHTGEKPFSCESCGKCFRQRVSYLVHRRIHTGVMPYKCTACNKSFRYKVSQRTHKCPAKPPGTVVRQAGDLVEKLKKKNATKVELQEGNDELPIIKTNYVEVSEANAELVRTGAKLSLEDMESENFTLIADTYDNTKSILEQASCSSESEKTSASKPENTDICDTNLDALIDAIPVIDKNIPSPSEILKNLCLSKDDDYANILQETEDDKKYDLYKDFEVFM